MTRFEEKDLAGFISQILIKNGQNRKKSLLGADVSGERVFLRASGNNFVTIKDSGKTKKLILAIRMVHIK
jgi:hypothetical protein